MARVKPGMTFGDGIIAVSEGNPGALTVLACIGENLGTDELANVLFWCDNQGLYGPGIWQLYKDQAGEDIETFYHLLLKGVWN